MSYGEGYKLSDDLKRPHRIARKNPSLAAAAGGAAAYASLDSVADSKKTPKKVRDNAAIAAGGIGGAAAGQVAYQAAGYGAKHANRAINDKKLYADPKTKRGYTKPEYKKKVEGHKKAHGLKDPNAKSDLKGYLRKFPKDVPGAKATRALAYTHMGRTGAAASVAATAAGAAIGAKHRKDKVEKAMHEGDPFEISKISAKTKLLAGAKRGLFDAAGVTHPKLREKAYAGNGPVKSKLYNFARTKTRKEMEPRMIALREDPAVKRAAFRIVREEAGKKVQAAKPYIAGAAVGGAATGAVAYANKDRAEAEVKGKVRRVKDAVAKNLTQEQIDRRKKVQAVTSRTTGALGLGALGAQGVGLAVSRGKLKKLPTLKDGKVTLRNADPVKDSKKIKDATVPMLATSAGIGSIGAFNFASYTKAEAKQHKR